MSLEGSFGFEHRRCEPRRAQIFFQPTIDMSTAPVDEPTAMSSTIPLTGSTIVATAAVVTTYSASADCTDSATPTCSGDVCVTMSCGCGSFTPDGAYDSLWNNVKPMMCATDLVSRANKLVQLRGGIDTVAHYTAPD